LAAMAPMPTEHVSKDDLFTALSWFDELSSSRGVQEYDRFFREEIISNLLRRIAQESRPRLDINLLSSLSTSILCNLSSSRSICLQIINQTLDDAPKIRTRAGDPSSSDSKSFGQEFEPSARYCQEVSVSHG
jgi:hypothetical protein